MTPAGLDTARRRLGLSIAETAALASVAEKTVNNWINGRTPIPADVPERLDDLESAMIAAVEHAVAQARLVPPPVALIRYRMPADYAASQHASGDGLPMGAHAMMIAWLDEALDAEEIETMIVWSDAGC